MALNSPLFRCFAVLGSATLLAGCMTASEGTQTPAVARDYTVSSVDIKVADEAKFVGRFEDEGQRKATLARLDDVLTQRAAELGGGPREARAVLQINTMTLRTTAGRSVGSLNEITGFVTTVDERANKINGPKWVSFNDQGKLNQSSINDVPIGLLITVASNAVQIDSGRDLDILVEGFASEVLAAALRGPAPTAKTSSATATTRPNNNRSVAVADSTRNGDLSDPELESLVKQARQTAEIETQRQYGVPCWSIMCEREVKAAQDEAEARVRQNAASANN